MPRRKILAVSFGISAGCRRDRRPALADGNRRRIAALASMDCATGKSARRSGENRRAISASGCPPQISHHQSGGHAVSRDHRCCTRRTGSSISSPFSTRRGSARCVPSRPTPSTSTSRRSSPSTSLPIGLRFFQNLLAANFKLSRAQLHIENGTPLSICATSRFRRGNRSRQFHRARTRDHIALASQELFASSRRDLVAGKPAHSRRAHPHARSRSRRADHRSLAHRRAPPRFGNESGRVRREVARQCFERRSRGTGASGMPPEPHPKFPSRKCPTRSISVIAPAVPCMRANSRSAAKRRVSTMPLRPSGRK